MSSLPRPLWIAAAVLALLAAAGFVAYRLALHRLQSVLLEALGPRASVGELVLAWNRIEVRDLRIRAAPGWPAADELRAQRVLLRPDLRSAFGGRWRIAQLRVEKPYLSLLRGRDGKLQLLPALLRKPAPAQARAQPPAASPLVLIDQVLLADAQVDFYDASVRQPPHHLALDALQVDVRELKLPVLDEPFTLALQGLVKGPQRDGRLKIDGRFTPAKHDAQVRSRLEGMDLVALAPYLLKVAEGGVKHGSLDLALDADVEAGRLKAPGTLVLRDVALGRGGSFAGVPQQAVVAALSRDGRIELHFTLAGRLDDPNFSLNEDLATRIASALGERLGVSVGGVVEGVGGLIKGLLGK